MHVPDLAIAMNLAELRRRVTSWYRASARDLPWRRTRSPYAVLVSELMLQQTQVDRVVPKYRAFLRRFPTFRALASSTLADVLRAWSGLGYNGRARRLWECARIVVEERGGRLPRDTAELEALPGIGPYTAGAVASVAFGARAAAVDVNIRRVLARSIDGKSGVSDSRAWVLARLALPPRGDAGDWNQALMDIGALHCRATPRCDACPLRRVCRAFNSGAVDLATKRRRQPRFEGSSRFYRGHVVRALARAGSVSFLELGEQVKAGFGETDLPWLEDLLSGLARDGLVALARKRRRARLP
jgi:A/G-specific adenine glycosylase